MKDPSKIRTRWLREIAESSAHEEKWRTRARKVVDRYRDERGAEASDSRFNILYANTEILKGAVYARRPIPIVRRRWSSGPSAAVKTAQILERCLVYSTDAYDFDQVLKDATQDMLLPGRAQTKLRYVPQMMQDERRIEVTDEWDGKELPEGIQRDDKGTFKTESYERVAYEEVRCDPVDWRWFRFSKVTRWKKCKWVAFGELMTRDDLISTFGDEKGRATKLSWKTENEEETRESRALVWTIWNKPDKKVYVVSDGYEPGPLKTEDDPLRLDGFFPCPEPVYDVQTTDSLIPIPNYCLYQDQADELDELTARIANLTASMKRNGAYDSNYPELQKIATSADNVYVAVENLSQLAEKGGLAGAIYDAPIEQIGKVLQGLYVQRDQCKQIIYEVTGISDILRGTSSAVETARAQEIKAQYGSIRISNRQQSIAKHAMALLRMKAEIIAEHFSQETLSQMSGIQLPTMQQKQQAQQQAQVLQQQGKPVPEPLKGMLSEPTWEEVMQILRSDKLRGFSIEIETDSTIAVDEQAEKEAASELVQAIGSVTQALGPAVQIGFISPDAAKAILKFTVRKFKATRELEDEIEKLQPQPQDPQVMLQQMQEQMKQAQQQLEQQKKQAEQELKGKETAAKAALDAERKTMQADHIVAQAQARDAISKIQTMADSFLQQLEVPAAVAKEKGEADSLKFMQQMALHMQQIATQAVQTLQTANAGKTVDIERDPVTGRPSRLQVQPTVQ